MSATKRHHMAKRGSLRFAAQCHLLDCLIKELSVADPMTRQYAILELGSLRANFFYLNKVIMSDYSRRLIDHLLQASQSYIAENRHSLELNNLAMLIRSIKDQLSDRTRLLRRLKKKLSAELDRLESAYLTAKQYEISWQSEYEWEALRIDQAFDELAQSVRKALTEEGNPYVRLNANRWVAQQRELLPLCELDCEILFSQLLRIPHTERLPIEKFWASLAIIATLRHQQIPPGAPLWQKGKELFEQLIAGDEMAENFDVEAARKLFERD